MQAASTTDPQATRPKRGIHPQPLHAALIADALLTMKTVLAVTGLSSATIYRKVASREFPQPVRLGSRCTRWRAGDVTVWLSARVPG